MPADSPLALIGLGLVGKALSRRLIGAGYTVVGYDISARAREEAACLGVSPARSAADAARASATVLLSLPDSGIVTEALWGAEGIAHALQPGALVLDTSTGWPQDAIENHRRLAELGVRFVDVTLSGSSEQIGRGEATAMVGDAEEAADYRPTIEQFAQAIFLMGRVGGGCVAKLIVNHVMGINRAALAEGLSLARRAGLDLDRTLELLQGSAAQSRVMEMKGRRMIEGDFAPASRITQHAKDVRLILQMGDELGIGLPLERAHAELLRRAIAAGWGDLDTAGIVKVYDEPGE